MMVLLAGLQQAMADPAITSTVPADGATGVSPGAAVVFNFNTAMDPTETFATFFDATASDDPPMISVWSAGNTVLTCTPSPNFANNHNIQWEVDGEDTQEDFLDATGSFTTVAGVNGGSGTNAVTTFTVSKSAGYHQTNAAAPVFINYNFDAQTTLASNRTATSITVTIPTTSATLNLDEDDLQPEMFDTDTLPTTSLTTFNATYPSGSYSFNVTGTPNQQQSVTLPSTALPNAPQVSNYTAAQAINPAQPFTLTWNAFTGGGSGDWIDFIIIDEDGVFVFQSPIFNQPGALTGTATSITIPAGTLQAGSNYAGELLFYHINATPPSGGIVTDAGLASGTEFSMITTAGTISGAAPVLTNPAWAAGTFGFDILTTPSQTLTVVYNTNLNIPSSTWPVLLTTNSPGSTVHISDPHSATNKTLFYRVRNGS